MNESLRPLQPLPEQLYTGNSQLWPPCCFTLSPYHICVCQTKSVNSWTPYPLNEFSSPSNSPWSSPCSPKAMAWTKLSIMTALLFEPHSYPMYVRCAKPNRSNLESLLIHWMNESLSLSLSLLEALEALQITTDIMFFEPHSWPMYVRCAEPNWPILDERTNRTPTVQKFQPNSELLTSHSTYTHFLPKETSLSNPPSVTEKKHVPSGRHRGKRLKEV